MAALLETVEAWLEGRGWEHERLPGRDVLRFAFEGDEERWACYAEAQEQYERVVFYSVAPYNVPVEQRAAVAEYITRVNYDLAIGNFELDYADGEVRFKTSLDVKGAQLTQTLVERAVIPNLHAMNTYLPGVAALVGGDDQTPVQLVTSIQSAGS